MKAVKMFLMSVCLATFIQQAGAVVIGNSNYVVQTYFANPHADEQVVAFDWDDGNKLYYSTRNPDWGLGFAVYQYNGTSAVNLYRDENAFFGNRVTAISGRIYFNDGGTYDRWTSDYYRYDPSQKAAPTNMGVLSDIYGLETRNGADFWAAGGWSASIYYSALSDNGELVSNPLVNLGAIGSASGPMVFDDQGNLYYSEGYVASGNPTVYRWSAAEIAGAIADPAGAPLTPAGHAWATLSAGSGASSMAMDNNGNILVTATSFTDPSQLQRLFVADGLYTGYEVLALSDERLETVRMHGGRIYVSSADGIFTVIPVDADQHIINDYDYDGKSDLAVFRNGYWSVFLMSGNVLCDNAPLWVGQDFIPVPGDYDGDGKADFAVFRNGYWSVFLMSGNVLCDNMPLWVGQDFIPVPGDYDGDGKTDFAVFRNGYWSIFSLTSGVILNNAGPWGGSGSIPVPGDYDGDGKADLAFYQDGYWSVFSLANGVILNNAGQWGSATAIPVPGDYDADGKADLAFYQDGYWSIFSLANGVIMNNAGQWGSATAIPVPGDYDGDGKADLAFYQDGYWSIFSLASGVIMNNTGPWGASDWAPVK